MEGLCCARRRCTSALQASEQRKPPECRAQHARAVDQLTGPCAQDNSYQKATQEWKRACHSNRLPSRAGLQPFAGCLMSRLLRLAGSVKSYLRPAGPRAHNRERKAPAQYHRQLSEGREKRCRPWCRPTVPCRPSRRRPASRRSRRWRGRASLGPLAARRHQRSWTQTRCWRKRCAHASRLFCEVMFGQSTLCAFTPREKKTKRVRWGCTLHDALPCACAPCSHYAEVCNYAADQECSLLPYWLSSGAWAQRRRASGSSSTPSGMGRRGSSATWRRKRRTCRRSTCGRLSGCARSAVPHDALAFLVCPAPGSVRCC